MAIFGRWAARHRLREATNQSLPAPVDGSLVDCTPWVLGGLWPQELSTAAAQTASLAEHLRTDLRRIADAANGELRRIGRAEMLASARHAAERRVIEAARGAAVARVESTVSRLRTRVPGSSAADPAAVHDVDTAQLVAAEPAAPGPVEASGEESARQGAGEPEPGGQEAIEVDPDGEHRGPVPVRRRRAKRAVDDRRAGAAAGAAAAAVGRGRHAMAEESGDARLQRLLASVARQEPGLRWAVGERADHTTVLATDLAHGWIPSGVVLPAGVQLLTPERRSGTAVALLGSVTISASYSPGDAADQLSEVEATVPSVLPRELPALEDLGSALSAATRGRDGLAPSVHTVASASAAGTGASAAEIELLRAHRDAARSQLLAQYPEVATALLLDCLLLTATEAIAGADRLSANYHFAWYRALSG
jgi:hypothetical protein